jgi:hypothetical protein
VTNLKEEISCSFCPNLNFLLEYGHSFGTRKYKQFIYMANCKEQIKNSECNITIEEYM